MMLRRNPDNRDRTHWLDDDGKPACWDTHQECARHKVEQLTAALAAQAARADAAIAALRQIRTREGRVCESYETCTHRACNSSYGAWAIADAALAAASVEAEPQTEASCI